MTHGNSTSALNHSLGSLFEPELGSQRFSRRRGTLGLPLSAENHVSIVVVRIFFRVTRTAGVVSPHLSGVITSSCQTITAPSW